MCFSQNQVLIIYPGIMKYIGNSKLKKKFNINASSEEVYNNYTNSDSVSVSKKKILGTGGAELGGREALAPPIFWGFI